MPTSTPTAPARDAGRGGVALLIIDMINRFDFAGGDGLKRRAQQLVTPILKLREQANAAQVPVIFVNDHFGEWHSEKSILVERAAAHAPELVAAIAPCEHDYFIIKPQFSGFYATNLPLLLPKLGVSRLVITGVATDICVLFTAADAYMRDYKLWIPEDAVAAADSTKGDAAMQIMRCHLGAQTSSTAQLDIATWVEQLQRDGVE